MDPHPTHEIPCTAVECKHNRYLSGQTTVTGHCWIVDCPNFLFDCPRHYKVPFYAPGES